MISASDKPTPHDILRKYFGYNTFRTHQLDIIESVIAGKDVFVLMPTGSGKSICYQIPSLIRDGIGLIISPLIALMQNQVQALRENGIRAEFLNSSLDADTVSRVEARVIEGEADILYVAPERLHTERFLRFLENIPIALFAIDEAHCVSQWGHDFRPEYLRISEMTRKFPKVPRIALTATADPATRKDILKRLDLDGAKAFISGFDRPNIRYRVQLKTSGKQQLYEFLRNEHPGHSGIVYVRTRKRSDEMADWLRNKGIEALAYHAGLDQQVRYDHQRRFLRDEGVVMVATIAFGMGIDKPDVRFVAHLDLPSSLEAYYQETGRAGRDGLPADAWMLYSLSDVVAMRKLLDGSDGNETFKRIQSEKLNALLGYCESVPCRRKVLLAYFGEQYTASCHNCDNCIQEPETWDGTIAAQKALSCVYRTGQRFGAGHLTDVLTGNPTARVLDLKHDSLKTFGVGRELSSSEWRSVYRQLLAAGILDVNMGDISGFQLTETSWPVLRGEQTVRFRKDPKPVKAVKAEKKGKSAEPCMPDLGEDDGRLFEALRLLRLDLSKQLGIPPYVIFHDRTLKEMAVRKPADREQLLDITGVGEHKAELYGEAFLEAIREGR